MQDDGSLQRRGIEPMSDEQRWEFLLRVADFLRFLHHNHVVFGDISGNNIVVRRVLRGNGSETFYPVFIDCDGCRLHGNQPFLKQANTPDWVPPEARNAEAHIKYLRRDPDSDPIEVAQWEAREKILTKQTDVYKFVVLLNRALHRGISSLEDQPAGAAATTVRSSRQAWTTVRSIVASDARADLIWRGLREDPKERPSMQEICRAMFGA
jgi:serine/threonine protein kinase